MQREVMANILQMLWRSVKSTADLEQAGEVQMCSEERALRTKRAEVDCSNFKRFALAARKGAEGFEYSTSE
jgi:hypothetical protein